MQPFDPKKFYRAGDKVVFNGKSYTALIPSQGKSPVSGSGWKAGEAVSSSAPKEDKPNPVKDFKPVAPKVDAPKASPKDSEDFKAISKGEKRMHNPIQGLKGESGKDGRDGVSNIPGPRGEQGPKGDKGDQGPKGDKGDKGNEGPQGPAGKDLVIGGYKFNLDTTGVGNTLIKASKPRAAELKGLVAGSGITLTPSANSITITGTGSQNLFQTISISGQSDVVADSTTDVLTLASDAGLVITTNASTDTITFARAAITGDIAIAQGSNVSALATVNSNVGSFGSATQVATFTVTGTGLTTAAGNTTIQIAESQVTNLTTDLGNKQPLDATLTALAAYNTNGLLTQTSADTFTGRTITGTASRLAVTNGNGVSGNPTLDIDSAYVGQNTITTLGTVSTGTWSATTIAVNKGGTGQTSYTNGQLLIGNTTGNTLALGTLTQPGAGLTITGGSGTITFALANDLLGVEGLAANGIATRTATDTWAVRTITGGGGVTVTNGDGVSGNPTLSISNLRTLWVPAGAMRPSVTGGCAALGLVASAANQPDISTLDFDATTEEYAQFAVRMPKAWNAGTVTAAFVWSHPATTVNFGAVWSIQGVSIADNETIAVAYGTQVNTTDTGGTTNNQYVSPTSTAVTLAGTPATGEVQYFRVFRKAADASDTLAVDARLHGVMLFYTVTTLDDT